ncbi:FAD-dependent monooxygenase [Qingshengfaniella alkalisoli]|uniref:UbiH/UbiF family hydroxylase n=1 Tax=Qingshengfaniella alkalisoli TaxID=2599296 RepID=A0A5B8IU15_9RHOB|nr:FAD-dependent monooxygenase [Qingshengfaniella alkalisoli]QDY69114.1 UbiH/UbiF family hydroxylase [Qingshengfaniella alkalisoli]
MAGLTTDVLVAGAGPAGLIASAAFTSLGLKVICIDPQPPALAAPNDLRSTAFLQPSQAFLASIGLWDGLAQHASPLQIMRIIDAGGVENNIRRTHDFDAADIGDMPFGWNIPNRLIREVLLKRLEESEHFELRAGQSVTAILTRTREAIATTSDGGRIRSKLVVAADGRNSFIRQSCGIDCRTTRYGQKALAFTVAHPEPHQNISTEIHRSGGPFTLVPLPDHDGVHYSAVVWMERTKVADELAALPDREFEAAALERSCGVLGPLTPKGGRGVFPMVSQHAKRLASERVALIAEAAHVVPPIGAQGLNMSLADISVLTELATDTLTDPGSHTMLRRYHEARWPDIRKRILGIEALNRASMLEGQILRDARMRALDAIYGVGAVRRLAMQQGLGAKG